MCCFPKGYPCSVLCADIIGRHGSTLRSRASHHIVPQLDSHHRPPVPATLYTLAVAQALTGQEREVPRRSTRDWEKRCGLLLYFYRTFFLKVPTFSHPCATSSCKVSNTDQLTHNQDWCTTYLCCSHPLGTTKRSARSRWWCASSPNLCTQPPWTTSSQDLHTQPLHTTSTHIHCAHPPCTSTAHIHHAHPLWALPSLNLLTQSPCTISTHDLHT
jgi:hypothetical protein